MSGFACVQCNVRPAAMGRAYCSKACANAATTHTTYLSAFSSALISRAKEALPGGSYNSSGSQTYQQATPTVYIPAPTMQTQQQPRQQPMMFGQQPMMMMQSTQQQVQQHPNHQSHNNASGQLAMVISASPPPPSNCAIPGCTANAFVDPSTGMPGKYCSKAHKKLGETCLFLNCGRPVYTDPKTGKKAQYCSRGHARLAQANGVPNQPPQQPVEQMPYQQQPAAPMGNSMGNVWPTVCQWDNCGKPVWVDPTGNPTKYCGRGHLNAAKQAGQNTSVQSTSVEATPIPNRANVLSNQSTSPPIGQMTGLSHQQQQLWQQSPDLIPLEASKSLDHSHDTALVICDMQEGYRQTVHHFPSVLATTLRMIWLAELVGIKVFLTGGRPPIYGSTVHEIDNQITPRLRGGLFIKTKYFGPSEELREELLWQNFKHAIICGVEAHIGVVSQANELMEHGISVDIVLDGVSSRNREEIAPSLRDAARTNGNCIRFRTSEAIAFAIIDQQLKIGDHGLLDEDFLAFVRAESQSISRGLKGLLGDGDDTTFAGSSEALD